MKMIKNVYSIYDSKAKMYLQTFTQNNHAEAIRAFSNSVNSPDQNNLTMHPEDFYLYSLCQWDDIKGEYFNSEPVSLTSGLELKQ